MPSTTSYRRGDIVLVSFPFTDLTATKSRPALIVSPDTINQFTDDLILAAITSQLADEEHCIRIHAGDFLQGSLPKPSMIKFTKLFTMHSLLIRKKIAALSPAKMNDVLGHMQKIFS